jgi:hypothetical protein
VEQRVEEDGECCQFGVVRARLSDRHKRRLGGGMAAGAPSEL